jgi:hypothetical protein
VDWTWTNNDRKINFFTENPYYQSGTTLYLSYCLVRIVLDHYLSSRYVYFSTLKNKIWNGILKLYTSLLFNRSPQFILFFVNSFLFICNCSPVVSKYYLISGDNITPPYPTLYLLPEVIRTSKKTQKKPNYLNKVSLSFALLYYSKLKWR